MNLLDLLNPSVPHLVYAALGLAAGWWLRRYNAGESKLPPEVADFLASLIKLRDEKKKQAEIEGLLDELKKAKDAK